MIDLYFWPTPNGHKITIALEEMGLPYTLKPVDIMKGQQFEPAFLAISPNNRIPAIVDHEPPGGAAPLSLFESGAILLYLAEKTAMFLPSDLHGRGEVLQWLFWQMGGLGPMAGQANHFCRYAPEKIAYATTRYVNELHRLFGVMDKRLADRACLAGGYSIADMACWPWVKATKALVDDGLPEFPHLRRWLDELGERPALKRGAEAGAELRRPQGIDAAAREVLFGQRARG